MSSASGDGQAFISVIGIDRYRDWPRLRNAVSDARGAQKIFGKLGFKQAGEPLLDGAATFAALHRLVTKDLKRLGKEDSLVLFFAGHGHTETTEYFDGVTSRRGYIIPADADRRSADTWLRLDHWLSDVANLSPKHILVVLDACYAGIALDRAVIQYRDARMPLGEAMTSLRARRSRRVITSAMGDQRAMDGGPRPGHSLFTGCLIEALTRSLAAETKRPVTTGSELGSYLQRRVEESSGESQTPDFGVLELDDRGELILPLLGFEPEPKPKPKPKLKQKPVGGGQHKTSKGEIFDHGGDGEIEIDVAPGSDPSALDPAFVAALDRHAAERSRGASVFSVVAGDATVALAGWARWAAGRGYLTLATEGRSLDTAISEVLGQIPWLRCVAAARASLAAASGRGIAAVDASLDARSGRERSAWIDDVAGLDRQARVSGWLLSALREPRARVPDLTTAPVQGGELMAILCRLAAPIGVFVHHPEPTEAWLERAISTTAALVSYLPDHEVAIGAPADLVERVLRGGRQSASLSMARQGVVRIAARAEGSAVRARVRAANILHDALARDPRTAGRFALDAEVPLGAGGPPIEVDLVAEAARLAVEIDGWYHFRDPQGYRAARITDVRLQRAGFFVMRFLAEDVGERLELIVDEIAVALRGRRTSSAPHGDPYDQQS